MKALSHALLLALASSFPFAASGQNPNWRQAIKSDPRFSYQSPSSARAPAKAAPDVSERLLRDLDEKFEKDAAPRDFISVGLKSIEDNFARPDVFKEGFVWRPDADSSFHLRSRITFTYNPRQMPSDPLVILDKVFLNPIRFITAKTFSF